MNRFPEAFKILHPPNIQMKFLLSICQKVVQNHYFKTLTQFNIDDENRFHGFSAIFQNQLTHNLSPSYFNNFIIVLAELLSSWLIKRKISNQHASSNNQQVIRIQAKLLRFKQLEDINVTMKSLQHKMRQFFDNNFPKLTTQSLYYKIKNIQDNQAFSYTYLLFLYYYYTRELLVQKCEYEPVQKIMEQLSQIKEIYNEFYIDYCKQLRYLCKKQSGLSFIVNKETTFGIIRSISLKETNSEVKVCLSQILRYLVQNGYECPAQDLIHIAQNQGDKEIKESIYYCLIYIQDFSLEAKQFLQKAIQDNVDIEANNYLIQERMRYNILQIEKERKKQEFKCLPQHNIFSFKTAENNAYHSKQRAKLNISSQQNTQLFKQGWMQQQENRKNEKESLIVQNNFNINSDRSGNDRSWTKGTFEEIKNLFGIAQRDGTLKRQDKDVYLLEKFLSKEKKFHCKGELGAFLIDRMIASIYRLISEKQKLSFFTVEKFIQKCMKSSKTFRQQFLLNKDQEKLFAQFQKDLRSYDKQTFEFENNKEQRIINFMKLLQENDKSLNNWYWLRKEIDIIRVDSIIALRNALDTDPSMAPKFLKITLPEAILSELREVLVKQDHIDNSYFTYFLTICKNHSKLLDFNQNWKTLLHNRCIFQLNFTKNKEICLLYLIEQSLSLKSEQIQKLIDCLLIEATEVDAKKMIQIILLNLEHEHAQHLENYKLIEISKASQYIHIKIQFFTSLCFNTLKEGNKDKFKQEINQKLINWLLDQYKFFKISETEQDKDITCIILMILENLSKITAINELVLISQMLLNTTMIVHKQHRIVLNQFNQSQQVKRVSEVAATIIFESIKKNEKLELDESILHLIFEQFSQSYIRTKLVLSQTLQLYSSRHKLNPSKYLMKLSQHFNQNVFDIKLGVIRTYLNILSSLQEPYISDLHQIFFYDEILFDNKNVTDQVNFTILQLLSKYIRKAGLKEFTNENFFAAIVHILENCQNQMLIQKSIDVIILYTQKFMVPYHAQYILRILSAFDNLCSRTFYWEQNWQSTLQNKKEQIYTNIINNEMKIPVEQVKIWIDKLLNCQTLEEGQNILPLLNQISLNQDLPDELFNIIEVEKCCERMYKMKNGEAFYSKVSFDLIEKKVVELTEKGSQLNEKLYFSKIANNLSLSSSTNVLKILRNLSKNQYKISIKVITNLLSLYAPMHQGYDIQNQKLIAETVVSAYENYQVHEILEKETIFQSVNSKELLEITLPIILKQNIKAMNQNCVTKLIQFYQQTSSKNKQSISYLFKHQQLIRKIMNSNVRFNLTNLFSQVGSQKLKKNCQIGLRIYRNLQGLEKINVHQQNSKENMREQQSNLLARSHEEYFNKQILFYTNFHLKIKKKTAQSIIIYSKIFQKLKKTEMNSWQYIEREKFQSKNAKQDYFNTKKDLQLVMRLFKKFSLEGLCVQKQKQFLEAIMLISFVNWSNLHQDLIENQFFTDKIEKYLCSNYLTIEMLQICSKMVTQKKLKEVAIIFNNILDHFSRTSNSQIAFNLLIVLENICVHYKDDLANLIDSQNNRKIQVILQNYFSSKSLKLKYHSIKCFRLLREKGLVTHSQEWDLIVLIVKSNVQKRYKIGKLLYFIQTLAIQSEDLQTLNPRQELTDQEISKIIIVNVSKKIHIEERNKLWKQRIEQIQNIDVRIEFLTELYLSSNSNELVLQNFDKFTNYFIFNPIFEDQRNQLINNIKYHQFQEVKLVKMLIHHYIQKLFSSLPALSQFQAGQQKILYVCHQSEMKHIYFFFESLLSQQTVMEVIEIISIIYESQIPLAEYYEAEQIMTLQDIQNFTLIKQIKKNQLQLSQKHEKEIKYLVYSLLKNLPYKQLETIISPFNKEVYAKAQNLIELLHLISHYKNKKDPKFIDEECNHLKIDTLFQFLNKRYLTENSNKREKQGIFRQVKLLPQCQADSFNQITLLQEQLNKIKNYQFQEFQELKVPKQLSKWSQSHLKKWAKRIKKDQQMTRKYIIESLSIIKAAIYSATSNKNNLRDNQLISCLLMLNSFENSQRKGRLFQISTGEGKSTIICAVAIVLALKGHKVDIVTTTSILAERDAQKFKEIYKKFSISVADNIDRETYLSGPKQCYSCDVVYGEISQFQFDYLRDTYNQYGTRRKRTMSHVIVDEVDSMLIDDSSKIAKISSNIAGMDKLEIIYLLIWEKLRTIKQNMIECKGKLYYLNGKIEKKQRYLTFYYSNQQDQQMEITDVQKYLQSVELQGVQLIKKIIKIENLSESIVGILMTIQQELKIKKIHIPSNFQKFVELQFPRWIESALLAYEYTEKIHYIIENGSPSPVDYDNTGKVEHSTHWANGLHQFLQLKHFLKLTPENLTTNFISNIKYFQLYEHLTGVTGTLGSQKCRETLSNTYDADIVIIPDSYEKQLIEYPLAALDNTDEWVQEIKLKVQYELNKNRGVLIICETIEYCNYIYYHLSSLNAAKIKLYTMNGKDQQSDIRDISPKEIIIATNLAGRGTDIKTNNIEEYGGLHVILTFLPKNLRVEEQAKGRTARYGNNGSCQIILNRLQLPDEYKGKIDFEETRDQIQSSKLDKFISEQKEELEMKDKIFQKFYQFLFQQKKQFKSSKYNKSIVTRQQLQLAQQINTSINTSDGIIQQKWVLAIQERWAFFLNKNGNQSKLNLTSFENKFDQFKNQIEKDAYLMKIIRNPYYYVLIGYGFLNSKTSFIHFQENQLYSQASSFFIKAIELDKNTVSAYVGIAEVMLKLKAKAREYRECRFLFQDRHCYKDIAIQYYTKAIKLLGNELANLKIMQAYAEKDQSRNNTLSEQVAHKLHILNNYKKNIEQIILQLRKSQKRITICRAIVDQSELILSSYVEVERNMYLIRQIFQKSSQHEVLSINFHHLQSQSKKLLQQLQQDQATLEKSRMSVNIQLKSLNPSFINFLLFNCTHKFNLSNAGAKKFILKQQGKDESQVKFIVALKSQDYREKQYGFGELLNFIEGNKNKYDKYSIFAFKTLVVRQELKNAAFTIKAENVKTSHLKALISFINCTSYQLELTIDKIDNDLQSFFEEIQKQRKMQIWIETENNFPKLSVDPKIDQKSIKRFNLANIHKIKDKIQKIIFMFDEKQNVLYIAQKFPEHLVTAQFIKCTVMKPFVNMQHIHLDFSLSELTPTSASQALKTISQLSKSCAWDLIFKGLKRNEFFKIFQYQLATEDLQIRGKKQFCNLFEKINAPYRQIYQYACQGIQYMLIARQRQSLSGLVMFGLGLLSTIEICAGIALLSTGVGTIFGISLMMESLVDIFTLYRVNSIGEFNMITYLMMKAVSVSLAGLAVYAFSSVGASLLHAAQRITAMKFFGEAAPRAFYSSNKNNEISQMSSQINTTSISRLSEASDLKCKKMIQDITQELVAEYFQNRNGVIMMICKMAGVDSLKRSNLKNKLFKIINQIVYKADEGIGRKINEVIKLLSSEMLRQNKRSSLEQEIFVKSNKTLNDIITSFCQKFEIQLYQIQSLLKFADILKHVGDGDGREMLLKDVINVETSYLVVDGIERQYKYEVLNEKAFQIYLNQENLQKYFEIDKEEEVENVRTALSTAICNLITSKLFEKMSVPLFKKSIQSQIFNINSNQKNEDQAKQFEIELRKLRKDWEGKNNEDRERESRQVSIAQILSNYYICSLLQRIKDMITCIDEHVFVSACQRGSQISETASINLKYSEHLEPKFEDLVQFIIQKQVVAMFIRGEEEMIRICEQNKQLFKIVDRIVVKVTLNKLR